jgi:hypothetical protein
MPPRGDVASFPNPFEGSPRNDNMWNASLDYVGKFFGKGNNAQARDERDAALIGIPIGFGAMIAVVVAVKRRRQKQKQK